MLGVELSVRDGDGRAVVVLRGELDGASAPTVAAQLTAVAAAWGPWLIVDLAGLEYIGYGGLGVLVRARRRAREQGGDLALAGPQQQVRRVLQATGLIDVFSVYPSTRLAAIGSGRAYPRPAAAQPGASRDEPIRPAARDTSGSRRVPLRLPLRCRESTPRRAARGACRWRRAAGGGTAA